MDGRTDRPTKTEKCSRVSATKKEQRKLRGIIWEPYAFILAVFALGIESNKASRNEESGKKVRKWVGMVN